MKIKCNCPNGTNEIIIEAEYQTDPIWCKNCGTNLDIDDFPLNEGLKEEIVQWVMKYGEWIDWENDNLIANGGDLEKQFNEAGKNLAQKVKEDLKEFSVGYNPSNTTEIYKNIN